MKHVYVKSIIAYATLLLFFTTAFTQDKYSELDLIFSKKSIEEFNLYSDFSKLDKLNLTLSASFSGSEGRYNTYSDIYKLNLTVGAKKGIYPHSFEFETSNSFTFSHDEWSETISSLRISFESNLLNFLKTYSYIQRFSDSYLGIQQQYGIGGGVKIGVNIKGNLDGLRNKIASLSKIQEYIERITFFINILSNSNQCYGDHNDSKYFKDSKASMNSITSLSVQDKQKILNTLIMLRNQLIDINSNISTIKNKLIISNSMLSFGVTAAALAELEKDEVTLQLLKREHKQDNNETQTKAEKKEIALEGKKTLRVAITPFVVFKPLNNLTISISKSWKLPIFNIYENDLNNKSKYKYRTEETLSIQYKLPSKDQWASKINIGFEFKHLYNNYPPFVYDILIRDFLIQNNYFALNFSAPKTHYIYAFSIGVEF